MNNKFIKVMKENLDVENNEELFRDMEDWSILNAINYLSCEINNRQMREKIVNFLDDLEKNE